MEKIGRVWGHVVQIEEEEGGHFNFFRVQIIANVGPMIRAFANVEDEERTRTSGERLIDNIGVSGDQSESGQKRTEELRTPKERHVDNTAENGIVAMDGLNVPATEVEAEQSKVGETQSPRRDGEDEGRNGADNRSPIVLFEEKENGPSPTKTKSLHDDRRTEDVIREWSEE
ncbi:hypothetical protein PIB30_086432 [Stylosanthes scabra]|uniref:Uncharacterized protein n=1 Tax=Stylosanthes scabra TaxID=79078 RepID=A0ABU6XSH2_9FABA|nr:hypothetical protein [Stylosanthes scabra]